ENAQATVAERGPTVRDEAAAVGPTRRQRVGHALNPSDRSRAAVETDLAADAAHAVCSLPRVGRRPRNRTNPAQGRTPGRTRTPTRQAARLSGPGAADP